MLRWSVLGAALLVNLPGLYTALVTQSTSVDAALLHLLITVPVVAVLFACLRSATSGRAESRRQNTARTRPPSAP